MLLRLRPLAAASTLLQVPSVAQSRDRQVIAPEISSIAHNIVQQCRNRETCG